VSDDQTVRVPASSGDPYQRDHENDHVRTDHVEISHHESTRPKPAAKRSHSGTSRTVSVVCWVALVVATAWLAGQWIWVDGLPALIAVQATPFVPGALAVLVATVALVRRDALMTITACVILGGVTFIIATSWGWGVGDRPTTASPNLTIASSNILIDNPELTDAIRQLIEKDADIMVIQEVDATTLSVLDDAASDASYGYRAADPQPGFHGGVIYSRMPIESWQVLDVAGSPMLVADIHTTAGPVSVVNVHTVAPLTELLARQWRRQFDAMGVLATETDAPIIFAGDFNATAMHRPMASLLSGGLRDSFTESGLGWGATFPANWGLVPPFMRIDHILISQELCVESFGEWQVSGSDHRAMTAQLLDCPSEAER
jgi:endonuclease/exonuclease/phosphatase (EEP) superfamily protein YafD